MGVDSKSQVEMMEALSDKSGDVTTTDYGTIDLIQDGSIVLIPTPSSDPKGTFKVHHPACPI